MSRWLRRTLWAVGLLALVALLVAVLVPPSDGPGDAHTCADLHHIQLTQGNVEAVVEQNGGLENGDLRGDLRGQRYPEALADCRGLGYGG